MDKRRKLLKPTRKGKSKKEQKTGKWRDKAERECAGPHRALNVWYKAVTVARNGLKWSTAV